MSEADERIVEMPTLTELLNFENDWPRWSGRKYEAIRARFAIPPARYFQLLHRAIDMLEALEARPMLVRRLCRIRNEAALEERRRRGAS